MAGNTLQPHSGVASIVCEFQYWLCSISKTPNQKVWWTVFELCDFPLGILVKAKNDLAKGTPSTSMMIKETLASRLPPRVHRVGELSCPEETECYHRKGEWLLHIPQGDGSLLHYRTHGACQSSINIICLTSLQCSYFDPLVHRKVGWLFPVAYKIIQPKHLNYKTKHLQWEELERAKVETKERAV